MLRASGTRLTPRPPAPAPPGGLPSTVTNLVFMGMGEPLDNWPAVERALAIVCDPQGLHMSREKVTVSTVGLVPGIRAFASSPVGGQLAVSLHATTDAVRDWIVPVNRRRGAGIDC